MKKALLKDTIKEITKNFKRFISILLIVLLGVGFFVGIKSASPDMKQTIDTYFDEQNVMDLEVISTLGFTKQDIQELQKIEGINDVQGSYQIDAIVKTEEKENVIKLEAMLNDVNKLNLIEGRLPQNEQECVVEPSFLRANDYKIGDTITIQTEEKMLKQNEITIVGTVKSPLYISRERGNSKLGSGKIDYYIYGNINNFAIDYYTTTYITITGGNELKTYETEYDDLVDNIKEKIEEVAEKQKQARYDDMYEQAKKQMPNVPNEVIMQNIQKPEWYILSRLQNAGYVSYLQDADRIANIAQVFPLVFFVVATLTSLTSMTRMIEEQRVQIGTLKALGYKKVQIAFKYIIYALLATLIGGTIGIALCYKTLPTIILNMYGMMYTIPINVLEFNIQYATIGLLVATICTLGATIYSCTKSLMGTPTSLMRPKAPKTGKRVFLEKIPFIWSKLNFTKKVTARNIFRYKKRFLMTIIGVAGCTALIIAGFGLRDAISSMIPAQYGKIFKYDLQISLRDNLAKEQIDEVYQMINEKQEVERRKKILMQSIEISNIENTQSIQLIVPETIDGFSEFIELQKRKSPQEKYTLNDQGIIITEKLAKLLDIKVEDTITLKDTENVEKQVKVIGITENYLAHYIYMSPDLYEELYQKEIEPNVVFAITNDLSKEQEDTLGKSLLSNTESVSGVTFTSFTTNIFEEVMNNLSLVVWILIIAAGLLALVVLYNLSNANISERIRELATIKVLGFYDKEVYQYVGKEMMILTIIGIIIGLVGGAFLTTYIIKTCELDMLMFNPKIEPQSYIYGIIITALFAIIVNIGTYFSLKKINMIEALKSVE